MHIHHAPTIGTDRLVARVAEAEAGDDEALRELTTADLDAAVLARCAASRHPALQQLAATHDRTPDDALVALASVRDLALQSALLSRATLPEEVLERLSDVDALLLRVLGHPDCPVSLLDAAGESNETDIQRVVAEHPRTPVAVLDELARRTADPEVGELLFQRATDDPERLQAFADAMDPDMRARVAGSTATPVPVLSRLARDTDDDVRAAVARRPDLPLAVARSLASDESRHVAQVARAHPAVRRRRLVLLAVVAVLAAGTSAAWWYVSTL